VAKPKKQGHGGYIQNIKGYLELRGRTRCLELWIQIRPENSKKLLAQIENLTKKSVD
jgi:hypothetical protein